MLFELYGKPQKYFYFLNSCAQQVHHLSPHKKKNGWRPGRSRTILFFCFKTDGGGGASSMFFFFFFHGGFLIRVPSHDHDARARGGGGRERQEQKKKKIADRKEEDSALRVYIIHIRVIKNRLTSRSVGSRPLASYSPLVSILLQERN